MSDTANFSKEELSRIYGSSPKCLLCGMLAEEVHHILKRGYDNGAPPKSPERKLFSSIYNAIPLCMKCHSRGDIHTPKVRTELLHLSQKAALFSRYIPNKNDSEFLSRFRRLYFPNPKQYEKIIQDNDNL